MITKDEILNLLKLKETMTSKQVASHLNISLSKVHFWLREARKQGLTTPPPQKAGRKKIDLTTPQ